MEFLELAAIVWRGRQAIAIATVIAAALAIVAAFLVEPVYRAEAVVMEVDSSQRGSDTAAALLGQFSGLAALANVDLLKPSIARNSLQSRSLVEQYISRNELLPVLFADDWNPDARAWSEDLEAPPSVSDGSLYFMEEVMEVATNADAGTIGIVVEWTDPGLAARWANGLVEVANEMIRNRDIAEARSNIEFLNRQIAETRVVELQAVLYGLLQTEQKTIMLANSRNEYSFKVIDPAIVPSEPVRPARLLMAVIGAIIGAFLGLMWVFLRRVHARMPATT